MARDKRGAVEEHWDAFNEANAIAALVVVAITAVGFFAGKYDYISVLEYWTLAVVCAACAVYIGKNAKVKRTKILLILLFLLAMAAVGLIVYRQDLRYKAYDASWDIAFSNTYAGHGLRGLQVGLCILNPNDFPIHVRVAAISANVDKSSGSYANHDPDRIWTIGRYSSNSVLFSDTMTIGLADSGPHTGTLQATVEYGREKDELDKQLNIRSELHYVQDLDTNEVVGLTLNPTTGSPPNSYEMEDRFRNSKCRRLGA